MLITSDSFLTSGSPWQAKKFRLFSKVKNSHSQKQGIQLTGYPSFVYLLVIFEFFVYLLTETFFDPHRPQFSYISADAKTLHCEAESI